MAYLFLLAFVAGAAIAVQAAMNAKLGVLLKSSILAAGLAFFVACLFSVVVWLATTKHYPQVESLRTIPTYLWFAGVLSAFGVGAFYFLIPKIGVGTMMSLALTGQLLVAVIVSHFGLFESPVKPINANIIFGFVAMAIGILLINWETPHAV